MGVGTRLRSRLTLSGSRDQSACLMAKPGIDTVHPGPPAEGCSCSWPLASFGGLPGWPSAAQDFPPAPCFLMAVPAQALTGPCGGCSGTHSEPPLTCLQPARVKIDVSIAATSAASTFSHLSLCQCLLSEWSTKCRAEPSAGR